MILLMNLKSSPGVSLSIIHTGADDSINPFWSANERTKMKLKIYLSDAWMCSEFGINNTNVEQERVNNHHFQFSPTI